MGKGHSMGTDRAVFAKNGAGEVGYINQKKINK